MIQISHLTKEYDNPKTIVLNDFSMNIQDGDLLAIMGKSGVGKTTLLNILGCIDTFNSGEYRYNDIVVSELSRKERHLFRREHFSFIFQNFELLKQYSVYENVELPLLARKIKNRRQIILNALDEVGILKHQNKKVNQLSGGEQQRCAIARAIVANTDVILADEPTGALDEMTANDIMALFKRIHANGKTIVIVTHDKDIANQCERQIEISSRDVIKK